MTNDRLKALAIRALHRTLKNPPPDLTIQELSEFGKLLGDVAFCKNCGGMDWFQLHEHGTWVEVCVDCGLRAPNEA